jgi:hypothetical protein
VGLHPRESDLFFRRMSAALSQSLNQSYHVRPYLLKVVGRGTVRKDDDVNIRQRQRVRYSSTILLLLVLLMSFFDNIYKLYTEVLLVKNYRVRESG